MKVKIYKPTEREAKTEAELRKAKADLSPVREQNARNDAINRRIRERYSLSEELSILRKAILNGAAAKSSDSEFAEYSAYAEACIAQEGKGEGEGGQ